MLRKLGFILGCLTIALMWRGVNTSAQAANVDVYGRELPEDAAPYEDQIWTQLCDSTRTETSLMSAVTVYQRICGDTHMFDKFGDPLHPFKAFTASVCNLRPTSRGHVRIKSADPRAHPSIRPNYLATPEDRQVAADANRSLEDWANLGLGGALMPASRFRHNEHTRPVHDRGRPVIITYEALWLTNTTRAEAIETLLENVLNPS